MAKRNVMEALNVTPDGSLPKNVFDLHSYEFYSSKPGMLIPVGYRATVPDGTYKMSVDNYTLTLPCNTASFADMKENYYFAFIPYYQLDRSFYSFSVQRKDLMSSLDFNSSEVPWFPLGEVVCRLLELVKNYCWDYSGSGTRPASDYFNQSKGYNGIRLLDMLGYGCYLDFAESIRRAETKNQAEAFLAQYNVTLKAQLNQYKPNVFNIAAYQKFWYSYMRNRQYDVNISPRAFNFDDVSYHVTGTAADYNILNHRSVDHFIDDCLAMRYVGYKKDMFTASLPGTQYGAVSAVIADFDDEIVGFTTNGNTSTDAGRWKHNDGVGLINGSAVQTVADNPQLRAIDSGGSTERILHDHTLPIVGVKGAANVSLFDVFKLVEANAIQKWRQKSMMAGQRLSDQYQAHYGVVPDHLRDDYPDFIGSVDNDVNLSQVVNQANTAPEGESNLGDLGARGYGASDNRTFTFHAKEYGVIMLFRAIIPENVYSSFGLDRTNQLIHYTDFWQPEYQNLGLVAWDKILLDVLNRSTSGDMDEHADSSQFLQFSRHGGFVPSNYQLKMAVSKTHGMFNPDRLGIEYTHSGFVPFGFADMQAFTQVRRDLCTSVQLGVDFLNFGQIPMSLNRLYVSPSIADSVFVVDADGFDDTDQFFHKTRFNCSAVQPLSVLGLPQF